MCSILESAIVVSAIVIRAIIRTIIVCVIIWISLIISEVPLLNLLSRGHNILKILLHSHRPYIVIFDMFL